MTFEVLLSQSLPFINQVLRYLISFYYVIGQENAFAQICAGANILQNCKNWGVNVGKCPICMAIYTPRLFWYANVMCHLPSLPHIYSSVFTFLRHIYKEQICVNPFFFLQWVMLSILSLWCSKKRNVISWAEGDRSKIGWCVVTSQEDCNRKILFSTEY